VDFAIAAIWELRMLVFESAVCTDRLSLLNKVEPARMSFKIAKIADLRISRRFRPGGLSCWLALGVFALAPSAALGQTPSAIAECNQFADSVNRNQTIMDQFETEIATFAANASTAETLPEITAVAAQYVEALDEVTNNLDTLSRDLEALSFEDTALIGFRDDYVTVVTGFNTALVIVRAAMAEVAAAESEAQLSASLESVADDTSTAVEQIEVLAVDESELIDEVNIHCGAESGDF